MKINVRHEAATEAGEPEGSEATPERTCVWTTGDDGETQQTAYLEPRQGVTVDVGFIQASQSATIGEVTALPS